MAKVYIKPINGAVVMDFKRDQPIPDEGAFVMMNNYYRRRIADQDAEIADPPAPSEPEPLKKSKSKKGAKA